MKIKKIKLCHDKIQNEQKKNSKRIENEQKMKIKKDRSDMRSANIKSSLLFPKKMEIRSSL